MAKSTVGKTGAAAALLVTAICWAVNAGPVGATTAGRQAGKDPFLFIVYGDTRTRYDIHQKILDRIRADKPDFVLHTGDDGIHYVVAGGGGAPLYGVNQNVETLVTAARIENYVRVRVDGAKAHLEAVDINGNLLDSFELTGAAGGPSPPTGSSR